MSRVRLTLASLLACGAVGVAVTAVAAAKATTMHFFSKGVYSRLSDAQGHTLGPKARPAPGDRFSFASNDYVGNHKHHAKRATASDHVDCVITSATTGRCDGTIAIGGSMIIGDDFVLNFASSGTTIVKITGGTGRFRHAHGTVVAKSVSNNATDFTIKLS